MIVLGIHCGLTINQHEVGAAIAINGEIVAACEEERYIRQKSAYGRLPNFSIKKVLEIAKIDFENIDLIVSPGITYLDYKDHLKRYFVHLFGSCPKILLQHHQKCHVALAFYASGFDEATCLSLDALGDTKSGLIAHASKKNGIKEIEFIEKANSLGMFYTMMTYYLGFIDGDEYKVMGLAPYGKDKINLTKIIEIQENGWKFNNKFLQNKPNPRSPFEPLYSNELSKNLGEPSRKPNSEINDFYKNLAASTQAATSKSIAAIAKYSKKLCNNSDNFCFSGGVALNCSAASDLFYSNIFKNIYIPPCPSDRGLAIGCAYLGAIECGDEPKKISSSFLGNSYSNEEIFSELKSNGCNFKEISNPSKVASELLVDGKVIGWHQGRSEIGARALGHRSILADPRSKEMKMEINKKIKYREEFRPFAPAVALEDSNEFFEINNTEIPFMNITVKAKKEKIKDIPATVHVDGTSRVQTVSNKDDNGFHKLITEFKRKTNIPVVLNTSFNLKGQPIVESPRDAIMTFYGCGLDALVIGNYLIKK
tara:strand:+ start:1634 stop:3247 length:1614 start_codon:yes stop_codon:yes gene_type:complete